jgi:HD-GYP domain-containing protein (c-di-GMP phosphodiesterase class II)
LGTAAETRTAPARFESKNTRALFLITAALGEKDSYTFAHAQRVAAYSRRIAIRAGLSGSELRNITWAGMLHDVGKIGLSDRIFSNQQAALSQEMIGEVQTHPLIGAQILRRLECHPTIFEAVLLHHERIDGSGYPFGLSDEEIPLSARIVSVADCFDAITTDRPYQRRKTLRHARVILGEMAGRHLAADLVDHLIRDVDCNGLEPPMPRLNIIGPYLRSV